MRVGDELVGETDVPEDPAQPTPGPDDSVVEREAPAAPPGSLRADFGAHFEAHYPRLVGQLFAITLDNGAAHDLVQDAYSRAWRRWSEVRQGDAEAWVRRVAVRASRNPLRRFAAKLGLRSARLPRQEGVDPRTAAVLAALAELPLDERRAAVLAHMAGLTVSEVAVLEGVAPGTVQARLNRVGHRVEQAVAGLAPVGFESTPEGPRSHPDDGHPDDGHPDDGDPDDSNPQDSDQEDR
jgi:RNA polymerase sigma-70 factor (ECF subfamily)